MIIETQNSNRSIEIINTPLVDFIFLPYIPIAIKDSLLQEFKDGLPLNYLPYTSTYGLGIYSDSATNPRVIVKRRYWGKKEIADYRTAPQSSVRSQQVNAMGSIANEFKIIQKVSTALNGKEAQDIAKKYGFDGISFVAPLMGFIEKPSGKKYLVYPFIKGKPWPDLDEKVVPNNKSHVQELVALLEKQGVQPKDLSNRQIMISGKHMFLIDMEEYYLLSNNLTT